MICDNLELIVLNLKQNKIKVIHIYILDLDFAYFSIS